MKPKRAAPRARKAVARQEPCPCGSGKGLAACCGPFLAGQQHAPTAQALMRSRYTAFARQDFDYILRTWHVRTRPPAVDLSGAGALQWTGLEIVACRAGGRAARAGTVEFIAHCLVNERPEQLHELSRFVREDGQWFYVDGEIKQAHINR